LRLIDYQFLPVAFHFIFLSLSCWSQLAVAFAADSALSSMPLKLQLQFECVWGKLIQQFHQLDCKP